MKDLVLILCLSLTVAVAGMLKSENNLAPKDSVIAQKFISFNH